MCKKKNQLTKCTVHPKSVLKKSPHDSHFKTGPCPGLHLQHQYCEWISDTRNGLPSLWTMQNLDMPYHWNLSTFWNWYLQERSTSVLYLQHQTRITNHTDFLSQINKIQDFFNITPTSQTFTCALQTLFHQSYNLHKHHFMNIMHHHCISNLLPMDFLQENYLSPPSSLNLEWAVLMWDLSEWLDQNDLPSEK